jgi:penicillin-binding protein 1A
MARQRRWGWLRRLVGWTAVAVLLAVGAVGWIFYREITKDLPPVEQLARYKPPVTTRIFSDDGTLIGEFFVERRYLVPLSAIPPHVRLAFLAAEDADFYTHPGVDPLSIVRAMLANVASDRIVQGGSTITQQVVKALLLTSERTYERKVKELVLALRLETKLSKDDILYLYLNQIYFGSGAYGVAAAAREFFDAELEDLTVAQAALLAGLPKAPGRFDPQRKPQAAIGRQRYVLDRMRTEGFISHEQWEVARNEELKFAPRRPATYIAAPYYVEHVRRLLEERYGGTAPYQMGLQVVTACDLRLQHAAEEALRKGLRDLDHRQGYRGPMRHIDPKKTDAFLARESTRKPESGSGPARGVVTEVRATGLGVKTAWEHGFLHADALRWGTRRLSAASFRPGDVISVTVSGSAPEGSVRFALDQEPQVEGALVAIDPYTGQVKAMVGGYDFGRSQFNRVTQAKRQPGSAFKPIVYAAAMEHGFTPASVVLDAPVTLPNGSLPPWSPRNFKDLFYGPTPLRMALAKSLNSVTVRIVDRMGIRTFLDTIPRFGLRGPFPRNLSIALGTAEVTPLELVRAYGVFATLGKRFEPLFVERVTDFEGNPLEFGSTHPKFEPVMSPGVAYVVTSMLETVVQKGTGKAALALDRPVAGKTGTTNDTHDAWFVGFTPDLLAGVWIGFDSERTLGKLETGGHAAAPIWTAFMQQALGDGPPVDFPVPEDVTFAQIDRASGLRAHPDGGGNAVMEVFVKGSEPTQYAALPDPDPEDGFEEEHVAPAAASDEPPVEGTD